MIEIIEIKERRKRCDFCGISNYPGRFSNDKEEVFKEWGVGYGRKTLLCQKCYRGVTEGVVEDNENNDRR